CVGDWLKQTGRPDPIRSETVLNQRADSSLGINGVRNHRQNNEKNDANDFQQGNQNKGNHRIHFTACSGGRSKNSSSLGSPGGEGVAELSGVAITFTPRSPILLKLKPASGGIDSAICRKTSSNEPRPSLPVHSCRRSGKISQSSRACPGGRTARFNRCKRPRPLIIEPRFSAYAAEGRIAVAWAVAALRKIFMVMKEGSFFSCSTVIPNSVGSSPST